MRRWPRRATCPCHPTSPRFVRLTAKWNVRGGIYTNVVAEYRKKGWKPPAVIEMPAHAQASGLA